MNDSRRAPSKLNDHAKSKAKDNEETIATRHRVLANLLHFTSLHNYHLHFISHHYHHHHHHYHHHIINKSTTARNSTFNIQVHSNHRRKQYEKNTKKEHAIIYI